MTEEMPDLCEAWKKDGTQCDLNATHGVLCKRHARQIAYAAKGSQRRRVIRVHLRGLSERDIQEAANAYLIENGYTPNATANPYAFRPHVEALIRERGEVSSSDIVAHVCSLTPYEISAAKTGQLLRVMVMDGTLARRQVWIKGSGVNVYAIREEVAPSEPDLDSLC